MHEKHTVHKCSKDAYKPKSPIPCSPQKIITTFKALEVNGKKKIFKKEKVLYVNEQMHTESNSSLIFDYYTR